MQPHVNYGLPLHRAASTPPLTVHQTTNLSVSVLGAQSSVQELAASGARAAHAWDRERAVLLEVELVVVREFRTVADLSQRLEDDALQSIGRYQKSKEAC